MLNPAQAPSPVKQTAKSSSFELTKGKLQNLDCSKISEVFVSPGISLKENVLDIFNTNYF